jgi:hypothetical protein
LGIGKSPLAESPAGLGVCLHQAMAVRRHGSSMMMVVTVMAAALHLNQTIKE